MHTNWDSIAIIIGGLGTVIVPMFVWLARHIGTQVRHTARETVDTAVGQAQAQITAKVDASDAKTAVQITGVQSHLAELGTRLVRVETQFGPNGGGLREVVDRINQTIVGLASDQRGMTARFEDHLAQSADDRRRLAEVERRLSERDH